jgi:thiamine transporter
MSKKEFSREKNISLTTKELCFSAILLAIAFVFSNIKIASMPLGGSVTMFNLLPIALIGYLFGAKVGLVATLAYGFLQLIAGGYVVHPIQLLLDYPLAYMALGTTGFFRNKKHGLIIGFTVGCILKYLCHVLTGVIFFSESGNLVSSLVYSLTYNAYIGPEVTVSLILIPILLPKFNKIKNMFITNNMINTNTVNK